MGYKLRRLERAALGSLMTLLAVVIERQLRRAARPSRPPAALISGEEEPQI